MDARMQAAIAILADAERAEKYAYEDSWVPYNDLELMDVVCMKGEPESRGFITSRYRLKDPRPPFNPAKGIVKVLWYVEPKYPIEIQDPYELEKVNG